MMKTRTYFLLIHILMSCTCISSYFAVKPGLPIPTWYKAKLEPTSTPELGKHFRLNFELQNLLGDLHNIELELNLPDGIQNLNKPLTASQNILKKAETKSWHWDLVVNREILGQSIQLKVTSKFPKEEITRFALGQYSEEPLHQKTQLANRIANTKERVDLHFQTTIYCTQMEGFTNVPDLIFRNIWTPKKFDSPFILFQYKEPKPNNRDEILAKITEFENYYSKVSNQNKLIDKFQTLRPMAYKRMLEDNFYRYYAVAISHFEEQDFKACDDWLQKLSLLILSQEELNSDFFLAIQNTRALCSIALQRFPEARKILKSSIQTEVNSSVRHYLFYNIAVILEKERKKAQMSHNLLQALSVNPSFTLAKELLKKYQ